MPQRLELVPTPRRRRHPLLYGAAFFLMLSLVLVFSSAIIWGVLTAGLAIVMAVIAFVIALRAPRAPDR